MKKIIISMAILASLFAGCQKSEMVDPLESVESVKPVAKQFVNVSVLLVIPIKPPT